MFVTQGYSVLAPDSRVQGESGGEFVTYGLLEKFDVMAWAHWLQRQKCQRIRFRRVARGVHTDSGFSRRTRFQGDSRRVPLC